MKVATEDIARPAMKAGVRRSDSERLSAARPWWGQRSRAVWVVAAVLTAAFLLTVVAGAIIAYTYHRKATDSYDLGDVDRMETGCAVVGTDGTELGRLYVEDRVFVTLDEVSPLLVDAVIATEDARFFEHHGFDKRGILRAAWVNVKAGGIRQGASTITQQLARHVYRLRGRNFDRKLTELFLARRLEERYSKREILEHYLNRIYLGSGYYGVGAACRGYFGKKAKDLTLEEAAMIAGIIKGPSSFSPYVSRKDAARVRNLTLSRMRQLGMIDETEYAQASSREIAVQDDADRDRRPYFAMEAVRREIERRYPATERLDGARVASTMHSDLQFRAIDAVRYQLGKIEQQYPQLQGQGVDRLDAAVIVLENRTGRIVATVGGRDFKRAPFDHSLSARRPPGTTFLPLTYATFFETDQTAAVRAVLDAPYDNSAVMVGGAQGTLAEWGGGPERYLGFIPASRALLESRTGAAVRLGQEAGLGRVIERVSESGVRSPLRPYPATFLGASHVKLIELARAFTVFPNQGVVCPQPHLIDHVELGESEKVVPSEALAGRVIFPSYAAAQAREVMAARLRGPEYVSLLSGAGLQGAGLAGQPGASYGFADGWFVGFDRFHTCAVWVGFGDGSSRSLDVEEPGRLLAFPLFVEVMAAAPSGGLGGVRGWPMGESEVRGEQALCLHSGKVATEGCWEAGGQNVGKMDTMVPPYQRPKERCDLHRSKGEGDRPEIVPATLVAAPGERVETVQAKQPVLIGEDPYSL